MAPALADAAPTAVEVASWTALTASLDTPGSLFAAPAFGLLQAARESTAAMAATLA
jgi:hypothetical protein